jgi:hypothetical protein
MGKAETCRRVLDSGNNKKTKGCKDISHTLLHDTAGDLQPYKVYILCFSPYGQWNIISDYHYDELPKFNQNRYRYF